MKIKFLLATLIFTFAVIPAFADITPIEASSPEYLYNHGHSEAVVDIVQFTKAGVNGEEYISSYELKHANDPKVLKWLRNVFLYLDPAMDDGKFLQHDTKPSPSYDDL